MTTSDSDSPSLRNQIVDELQVQAWLAKAELDHPSLHGVRDEVSSLAQMRDELRVQAHLGRMELTEEWKQTEDQWRRFMQAVSNRAHDVGEEARGLMGDIRTRYQRLRGS